VSKLLRRQDWRTRLGAWATTQVGKQFVWGQTDCASLAREALCQMFGRDLIPVAVDYSTAYGATRALAQFGDIGSYLEELGAERTTPAFLRAGDIVLMDEPTEAVGGVALMICLDSRRCLMTGPNGVSETLLANDAAAAVYSLWEVVTSG
jgi:hypothetical protein